MTLNQAAAAVAQLGTRSPAAPNHRLELLSRLARIADNLAEADQVNRDAMSPAELVALAAAEALGTDQDPDAALAVIVTQLKTYREIQLC